MNGNPNNYNVSPEYWLQIYAFSLPVSCPATFGPLTVSQPLLYVCDGCMTWQPAAGDTHCDGDVNNEHAPA